MKEIELNELLLSKFPELKKNFEEETSWQDGLNTGCIVTFEDVFMPLFEKAVDTNNENLLKRISIFIEELSNIDDDYVQNVFYIAILENISSYKNKEKFITCLLTNSKRIYTENF
jgi:hypothetical protein